MHSKRVIVYGLLFSAAVLALVGARAEPDPAQESWIDIIQRAEKMDEPSEVDALLDEALSAPLDPSVSARLRSYRARRKGRISDAVIFAQESLAMDPDQPMLRTELFDLLVAEARYNDAGIQVVRLEERIRGGESDLLPEYTELLVKMGTHPNGSEMWKSVRIHSPHTEQYALKSAMYLKDVCRTDEAVVILTGLISDGDVSALVYTTLADLELAIGNVPDSINTVKRGLEKAPVPFLYRQMAELAEITFAWVAAKSNALQYVAFDSGFVPMQRLASRSMLTLKEFRQATDLNEALLKRNALFRQGYVDLRDAYAGLGDDQKALSCAQRLYELNPQDPGAIRRLAVSYGETMNFAKALAVIKPLADLEVQQAVPIILFRNVSNCELRGVHCVEEVGHQLRNLSRSGYRFITPEDLLQHRLGDEKRIVVIINNPDPSAVHALDLVLREIGGKAVLAVDVAQFRDALVRVSGEESIEELKRGGRWFLAASGPLGMKNVPISASGNVTGNPMTHRIIIDGDRKETYEEMERRLDALLSAAAVQLQSEFPVFVYPFGDDGQLSLDCTDQEIGILRSAVSNYFKMAIIQNDTGYAVPAYDPLRLPAKTLPAPAFVESTVYENASNPVEYLEGENPVVRAKLDMATLLSRQKQYPRANEYFEKARASGADRADVAFNRGMNSFQQGDLPSALVHLRLAHDEGSVRQEEVLDALYRVQNEMTPRLGLHVSGWEDSDTRSFLELGGTYSIFLCDEIRLGGFYDYLMYDQVGLGHEEGHRIGLDSKWFVLPECWISAQLWLNAYERTDINDNVGGRLNLHSESAMLNGYMEAGYMRDQVQTVEAVREEIQSDVFTLRTYSFIYDRIDIYADGHYIDRTDNNASWYLNGRVLYRMMNHPDLGAGYHSRFGSSDSASDAYYTPDKLEHHALLVSLSGIYNVLHYTISTEGGAARDAGRDWAAVWGFAVEGEVQINSWLQGIGSVSRAEEPGYYVDTISIGLQGRF